MPFHFYFDLFARCFIRGFRDHDARSLWSTFHPASVPPCFIPLPVQEDRLQRKWQLYSGTESPGSAQCLFSREEVAGGDPCPQNLICGFVAPEQPGISAPSVHFSFQFLTEWSWVSLHLRESQVKVLMHVLKLELGWTPLRRSEMGKWSAVTVGPAYQRSSEAAHWPGLQAFSVDCLVGIIIFLRLLWSVQNTKFWFPLLG